MGVKNTKGLTVFMSTTSTPATLSLAAADTITNAKPAVVNAADTTGVVEGMLIKVAGTGWPELDGKSFIVGSLTADSDFELVGSDGTSQALSLTIAAGPLPVVSFTLYDDTADMVKLCLSTIGVNAETATPVSVGTFCDVNATVPGNEGGAGTVDFGFFLDKASAGYAALIAAEADGNERQFKITFPDNGDLLLRGIVSSVTFTDIPLEGSAALTAQITLATKPLHAF